MPRNEVTQIPKYIKQNQPVEISPRGQAVYAIQQPNGEIRLVTTPHGNYSTISSMYIKNKISVRNPDAIFFHYGRQ